MAVTPTALILTAFTQSADPTRQVKIFSNGSSCGRNPMETKANISAIIFPIQIFIGVLSLLSNFCNIVVLSRRKMINATNTILTGMAVCDLITCVFYVTRCLMNHLLDVNTSLTLKRVTIIFLMISITSHTCSIWLTVLLSIFRFFIIHTSYASPRSSDLWGFRRSITATVLICVAVTLFLLPVYATIRYVPNTETLYNVTDASGQFKASYNRTIYFAKYNPESFSVYNFASNAVLAKVIPCVLLTFFGVLLLVTLHKANKRRMSLMEESRTTLSNQGGGKGMSRRERNSRRITRMLLTVIIIFVMVELPNGCLMCLTRVSFTLRCIYTAFGDICDLASLTKNAVTFVLYCTMSTEFRHTFRSTFCQCINQENTTSGNGIGMATEIGERKTVTTAAFVVDHLTAKGKAGGYSQAL